MTDQTRPMDAERIAEWDEQFVGVFAGDMPLAESDRILSAHETPSGGRAVIVTGEDIRRLAKMAQAQHAELTRLLAEVARLTAERDAARKRADERCEFDYKDGYEDGHAESDADLRAVIEEARDEVELMYDSGVMQHGSQINVLAILDRVKGDEK